MPEVKMTQRRMFVRNFRLSHSATARQVNNVQERQCLKVRIGHLQRMQYMYLHPVVKRSSLVDTPRD